MLVLIAYLYIHKINLYIYSNLIWKFLLSLFVKGNAEYDLEKSYEEFI